MPTRDAVYAKLKNLSDTGRSAQDKGNFTLQAKCEKQYWNIRNKYEGDLAKLVNPEFKKWKERMVYAMFERVITPLILRANG